MTVRVVAADDHEVVRAGFSTMLVAAGLSNGEIARRLTISEETVMTHVGRILVKLGLRGRTQAVIYAYEMGMIVPGPSRLPGTS